MGLNPQDYYCKLQGTHKTQIAFCGSALLLLLINRKYPLKLIAKLLQKLKKIKRLSITKVYGLFLKNKKLFVLYFNLKLC